MNDFIDPNLSATSSASVLSPEALPMPVLPEGVDEQIEADDNDAALRDCGLSELEVHACAIEAAQQRAGARRFLHPWHLWGVFSAYFFSLLAEKMLARGWACVMNGNSLWLRSRDKRYGLVIWPGNNAIGKRGTRARNVRAKGQETRSMLESVGEFIPGLDLGPEVLPVGEDGEGVPFESKLSPEEYPQEFLSLLYRRVGNEVKFEVQILPKDALTKDGFVKNTRRRIFLHAVEVQSLPVSRPIEMLVNLANTQVDSEIEVPMAPVDDAADGSD